jgi:hypothetical protein
MVPSLVGTGGTGGGTGDRIGGRGGGPVGSVGGAVFLSDLSYINEDLEVTGAAYGALTSRGKS